jgi:ankyrin repeat protein
MFGWVKKSSLWEWADKRSAENILRQLEKSGLQSAKELNDKLVAAAKNNKPETVKALVKAGASPDAQLYYSYGTGSESYSIVSWAAARGDMRMVQALAQSGADLNKRDTHDGHTALIEATRRGNSQMVRLLLDLGADTSVRTSIHSKENIELITPISARGIAERHAFANIMKMIDDEPARRQQARLDALRKQQEDALRLKQEEEAAARALANKDPSVTQTGQPVEVMETLKLRKPARHFFT